MRSYQNSVNFVRGKIRHLTLPIVLALAYVVIVSPLSADTPEAKFEEFWEAAKKDPLRVVRILADSGIKSLQESDLTYAELALELCVSIGEEFLKSDDTEFAKCLTPLSAIYLSKERYPEGEALLRQALSIYKRAVSHELPHLLFFLGVNLKRQKRYSEAEEVLL